MATTAIAMRTKDSSGTMGTTTINYVNPEATSSQLQSLASAFNNLTTNTLVDVTRIDKQVLGSEIEKLPRNAYFSNNSDTTTPITTLSAATIPLAGDGTGTYYDCTKYVRCDGTVEDGGYTIRLYDTGGNLTVATTIINSSNISLSFMKAFEQSELVGAKIEVTLLETDTYAAQTVTLEIVA